MGKIKYSKGLKYKRLGGGKCTLVGIGRCKDRGIIVPPKVFLYGEVVSVYQNAFRENEKILGILLPDTVKSIGESAFYNCKYLIGIYLPDSLEEIGEYAFRGCRHLDEVVLPQTLKAIPAAAFAHCDELSFINLDHVEKIGMEAFYCCGNLQFVDLSNAQWVSKAAFKGCENLESIIFSENLEGIGAAVFAGTEYHLNKNNWTKEGILYLDGWVLTTTGENRPYVLDKNTKGIGREAFYEIYEKKKEADPPIYTAEDEWYIRFYGEPSETRKKYTIDLIYPGTSEEWSKVKKSKTNDKYVYKIQTADGILEEEF